MLLSLAVATVVVTSVYFMHGPGLVLTRINQTERITVECKAGPPTVPVPSSENSKPSLSEIIILVLCVCAMLLVVLGFLKLMTAVELVERIEKVEARLEQWGKHDAVTRETIMRLLEPAAVPCHTP
jgi:hypothetical protein